MQTHLAAYASFVIYAFLLGYLTEAPHQWGLGILVLIMLSQTYRCYVAPARWMTATFAHISVLLFALLVTFWFGLKHPWLPSEDAIEDWIGAVSTLLAGALAFAGAWMTVSHLREQMNEQRRIRQIAAILKLNVMLPFIVAYLVTVSQWVVISIRNRQDSQILPSFKISILEDLINVASEVDSPEFSRLVKDTVLATQNLDSFTTAIINQIGPSDLPHKSYVEMTKRVIVCRAYTIKLFAIARHQLDCCAYSGISGDDLLGAYASLESFFSEISANEEYKAYHEEIVSWTRNYKG